MELFDSYILNNAIFCDISTVCAYPDPNSRVYCHEIKNECGICNGLIVTNEFVLCDCNQSWNCNLCANDLPFWIPFESKLAANSETFDFQFHQPYKDNNVSCEHDWLPFNLTSPTNSSFATFEIRTCCNDEALTITEEMFDAICPNHYVGSYNYTDYANNEYTQSVQQIRFNLNAIRLYLEAAEMDTCFYFVFKFSGRNECIGINTPTNEFCSEPFKPVICNGNHNLQVIESFYPQLDCFDMYHGLSYNVGIGGGSPFQYSNKITVPGYFEQSNFSITKEIINTSLKTTMTQTLETWQLKTTHLPQSFVKYLVNVLSGKNVYVNGIEYQMQGDINKNNEAGSQWYLQIDFQSIQCNKSLSCE